ncbi:hypothetical protein CGRA01v4_04173 [Colletotrichum graminicola]|nr:hypothetical protein CGRA01v4_04173 [Colletotrichum graminicola]
MIPIIQVCMLTQMVLYHLAKGLDVSLLSCYLALASLRLASSRCNLIYTLIIVQATVFGMKSFLLLPSLVAESPLSIPLRNGVLVDSTSISQLLSMNRSQA